MTLLQKYGLAPEEIERRSLEMVEAAMPPTPHLTARERYVLGRIVRAEGEPQIVDSVRFSEGAVERGIAAIRRGRDYRHRRAYGGSRHTKAAVGARGQPRLPR